jgi:hypothetical protein
VQPREWVEILEASAADEVLLTQRKASRRQDEVDHWDELCDDSLGSWRVGVGLAERAMRSVPPSQQCLFWK